MTNAKKIAIARFESSSYSFSIYSKNCVSSVSKNFNFNVWLVFSSINSSYSFIDKCPRKMLSENG